MAGEAIAAHPEVDMVSFTGSTRAGSRVIELAAESVKRVALELGGKSANVLLDDADLAAAVPAGVFGCYLNSGQTCSALTRMIVPRPGWPRSRQLAAAAAGLRAGRPVRRRAPGSARSSPPSSASGSAATSQGHRGGRQAG